MKWKSPNGKTHDLNIKYFTGNITSKDHEWRDYNWPNDEMTVDTYRAFEIKTKGCSCCVEEYKLDRESYIDFLKQYRDKITKALKVLEDE